MYLVTVSNVILIDHGVGSRPSVFFWSAVIESYRSSGRSVVGGGNVITIRYIFSLLSPFRTSPVKRVQSLTILTIFLYHEVLTLGQK